MKPTTMPLEQKLRMLVIDDNVVRVDDIGENDQILKIDPDCLGEKYTGMQERYGDIFTIDKALTFQDPGIPREYWAKFKLKDTKYDLIVLGQRFVGQIQHGWEILDEIRKIERGCCPLNAGTFVLGYSLYYTLEHCGDDKFRKLPQEEIVKRGLSARVTRKCLPQDLFAEIDRYLADYHPEKLGYIHKKVGNEP